MRKFCKVCGKSFPLPYPKSTQVTCGSKCRDENKRNLARKHQAKYLKKVAQNPKNKLKRRFETSTYLSIKKQRNKTILEVLGYTIKDLYNHIESQFTDGMSWENMGEWHLDHIIPVSAFNFNFYTDSEFFTCWSLGNLRPMWAKDNKIKGSKILGVSYA